MPYILLKKMKVQTSDLDARGKPVVEQRYAGDPVPEAEHWDERDRWIRQGFISPAPVDHPAATMHVDPPRREPTIVSNAERNRQRVKGMEPVDKQGRPTKRAPEPVAASDSAPEGSGESESAGSSENASDGKVDSGDAREALMKLDRTALKEFAMSEYELKLDGRMGHGAMIDAIMEAAEDAA